MYILIKIKNNHISIKKVIKQNVFSKIVLGIFVDYNNNIII